MQTLYEIIEKYNFETKVILKQLIKSHTALWELKWLANTLPNKTILTSTLSLQEAKDSSAIENIITTQDELYKSNFSMKQFFNNSAKEVYNYAEALNFWFEKIQEKWILTNNIILQIQEIIEENKAWFRKLPWTELKNEKTGETVYTPPQNIEEIKDFMSDLERFINDDTWLDSLINIALIHHQFESIHPFYDWNGRTWRIINILYLLKQWLLETPILYLSRYINQNKNQYYKLLQSVRDNENWEEWILFILKAIEETSIHTIEIVKNIKAIMLSHKQTIRSELPKIYSQDLINNIFKHPYTKIDFVINDLDCSRITATRYLEELTRIWILEKYKIWRDNFYMNKDLYTLLENVSK